MIELLISLAVLLVVLKYLEVITVPWSVALLPLWLPVAGGLVALLVATLLVAVPLFFVFVIGVWLVALVFASDP